MKDILNIRDQVNYLSGNRSIMYRNAMIALKAGDRMTLPIDYKEDFSAIVRTDKGPRFARFRVDKALDIPVIGQAHAMAQHKEGR